MLVDQAHHMKPVCHYRCIGEVAPGNRAVGFRQIHDHHLNVIAALLVGYVLWRLVRAALHTEKRMSDASEDVDPSEIPAATRLDTLTPLFRNVILFFLAAVIFMIVLKKFEWPIFFVFFGLLIFMLQPDSKHTHGFTGDELRYIRYAVSMQEHGVFGLSKKDLEVPPQPSNANAPLYPALMAGVMVLDDQLADSLKCIVQKGGKGECDQNFQSFFFVQVFLSVVCLFLIYYTAFYFSSSRIMGWLAALLALGSGIFTEFAYIFMTEALILPAFAGLVLTCLVLCRENKAIWVFIIAVVLAVLTLIRPS